jgi:hypothetical protein
VPYSMSDINSDIRECVPIVLIKYHTNLARLVHDDGYLVTYPHLTLVTCYKYKRGLILSVGCRNLP